MAAIAGSDFSSLAYKSMETRCNSVLADSAGRQPSPLVGAIVATFSASGDQEIGRLSRVIREADWNDEQETG